MKSWRNQPIPPDVHRRMVLLRRDLHEHPELSNEEERTAQRICAQLDELGVSYRRGVGGHGIIADIPGRSDGPLVALRADMDALPIHEETGLPFSSKTPGVMHACGHDGHSSILVGVASLLRSHEPPPVGVRLLWQPAEETATGASAMIAAGALEGVGMVFGGHLDRHYPPGKVVVTDGAVNASTDMFRITIRGQQGHGARPHEALDAVVVGSLLVTAIQTIVSREVDPADPSVVSVGVFHAGSAANVIAGRARLEGTIRAQSQRTRKHLQESIRRIAKAIGELHRAQVQVEVLERTPPLVNRPTAAAIARQAAVDVVGDHNVRPMHTTNMGGEDFACYLEEVPGCYVRFGAQVRGRESFPAHSSQFDFDESALDIAAAWFVQTAHLAGDKLSS